MIQFVGLSAKTFIYLIDESSEDKKAKGTRKCVIKRKKLKLGNYKSYLKQLILRINDL